jgi:hypothetical protein
VSPTELRPLALGEIIDRSASFWRRHLKSLFLITLGFDLVGYLLAKSLQLGLRSALVTLQSGALSATKLLLLSGRMLLGLGLVLVVSLWLYWLANLVVSRYVVPQWLGESAPLGNVFRQVLPKLKALTGAYALSLLWAVGVLLLLMLPSALLLGGALALQLLVGSDVARMVSVLLLGLGGVLLIIATLGTFLWYLLRFCLLAPALAMEELSAMGAFRRSGQLLSGRVEPGFTGRVGVRAMLLVTVVSAILFAVSLLSGLPALVVRFAYGTPLEPALATSQAIPQLALVPAELFQVLGQALFTPLALVFYATFYLDMRMRREGLDLERRLALLEARESATS